MVNTQAIVLLLALAVTIPLRAGDFDLSVAAVMTASAAVVARLSAEGQPLLATIAAALLLGLVVGLLNALLVVVVGVDAFITTLGMLTALGGVTYAITDSKVIVGLPAALSAAVRQDVFGLPAVPWLAWIVVAVLWYVYERTPLGRYLLFVGGSRESSLLSGLPVRRLRMGAFLGSALLAAATGVLLAGQLGAVDPSIGPQYLLQPFAAAFLGATTITVGRLQRPRHDGRALPARHWDHRPAAARGAVLGVGRLQRSGTGAGSDACPLGHAKEGLDGSSFARSGAQRAARPRGRGLE